MVLALSGLLASVAGSALAQPRARSQQVVCANNLQQVGRAFALWSDSRSNSLPWRVPVAEGGSFGVARAGNVWMELSYLSNFLVSPRVFACPADESTRRIATDFSNRPDGGLLHFNYRGNAVSYALGLDALVGRPNSWVCTDRNIRVDSLNIGCSTRINNGAEVRRDGQSVWTNAVHGLSGNVLHGDGRVSQYSTEDFRANLYQADEGGGIHLLMPR